MQAILLLAHRGIDYINEFCYQFHKDNRFDIYIHYDKKLVLSDNEISELKKTHKNIKAIISLYDGKYQDMSLVNAELELIKLAVKNEYSYYHLMSEQCYVSTTLDFFYNFFEKSTSNYVDVIKDKEGWQIINKEKNYRYSGSQWWSLTHECVKWILQTLTETDYYNDFSNELYKHNNGRSIQIIAADESFFTTLIMAYKNDFKFETNQRFYDFRWPLVDFMHPYILTIDKLTDYINMGITNALIIRKIDINSIQSIELINYIKYINRYR